MRNEVFTHYVDMPTSIRSFVVSNNDMSFTVIINSRIGHEQQLMAYEHEINHIINGDFDSKVSVDMIELATHGI